MFAPTSENHPVGDAAGLSTLAMAGGFGRPFSFMHTRGDHGQGGVCIKSTYLVQSRHEPNGGARRRQVQSLVSTTR